MPASNDEFYIEHNKEENSFNVKKDNKQVGKGILIKNLKAVNSKLKKTGNAKNKREKL